MDEERKKKSTHHIGGSARRSPESHGSLSKHFKALADSLNRHWTNFFAREDCNYKEFDQKRAQLYAAKGSLYNSGGTVEVPVLKERRFGKRHKFFKIRFGDLYKGDDMKQLIPDPMLLAFTAAVNWSGRKEGTRTLLFGQCSR